MRLSDLEKYDKITVQCHDNPDADSLAAGYGLYCYFKSKGKDVRLVYCGRNKIQKSNLCLMVDKLKLPIEYISLGREEKVEVDGLLITVDCQYGSGNVTGLKAKDVVVIDHHPLDEEVTSMRIINTNVGSCATLIWKLLLEEDFDIDSDEHLGTALYYGLYTDTNQFSELFNPWDMDMRETVNADMGLIKLFRNSNLSLRELEIAGIAMMRCRFNDDYEFAVIKAQPCDPNILGLISDFLLQVDAIKTCVVFNEVNDGYKFSVRSCISEVNASELATFLAEDIGSGGGHYEKAGGFISLKLYEEKYPALHSEGYFNNRMVEYFDSFELIYAQIYAAIHEAELSQMQKYVMRRLPVGIVRLDEVLSLGSCVTIRTLDGDIDMIVREQQYAILSRDGKIRFIDGEEFQREFELLEDDCNEQDYFRKMDYIPVIKRRGNRQDMRLTDYAKYYKHSREKRVYARPLEKAVKVFPIFEKEKYMPGKTGDYLVVDCEDMHDIYVVEKEIFPKTYDRLD